MCWLAGFWMLVLKAFPSYATENGSHFWCSKLWFGRPGTSILARLGPFWHIGGSWAALGAAGRTRGALESDFARFWDDVGTPFWKLFGRRGLEIRFCFRVRFDFTFDADVWNEVRAVGALKICFFYGNYCKNNMFAEVAAFCDFGVDFQCFVAGLGTNLIVIFAVLAPDSKLSDFHGCPGRTKAGWNLKTEESGW